MSKIILNKEQQEIMNSTGNILVSASAGSGKTSTLITKVMDMIANGVDIRKILIMTFTKAAANEMKERLISYIYDRVRHNDAKSTLFLSQLNNLPFSNISTIHSFYYTLYKKYFALIKADPSSEMLDENQSANILEHTIDDVVEEYINNNDEDFLKLANHFSHTRKLDEFKKEIKDLNGFLDYIEDIDKFKKQMEMGVHTKKCVDSIKEFIDENVVEIANFTSDYKYVFDEKGYQEDLDNAMSNLKVLENILNTKDFNTKVELFGQLNLVRIKKGKAPEIKEYLDLIVSQKKNLVEVKKIAKTQNNFEDTNKIFEVTMEVKKRYIDYKKRNNVVDFSDLSYYCLKILEDENAKNEIRDSFDYIFVDEYQDTNYIQETMLDFISRIDNVIVVGDPKQSIYQFRYSEPKIFINRMNSYENKKFSKNIFLSQNYRSDKEILKFINYIFNSVMTNEYCGIDYRNQGQLQGGIDFDKVNDLDKCAIYTYEEGKKEKVEETLDGFYSVRDSKIKEQENIEGEFIAKKIIDMVNKKYLPDAKNSKRLIKYSDIAIIARTNKQGYEVVKCLKENNIPVNHKKKDGEFIIEREVLIDYLRLLYNINQDIPLANCLLSPLYNFSKTQLMEIHKSDKGLKFSEAFLSYTGDKEIEEKRDKFISDLEKYRFQSSYKPVSSLIVDIMEIGSFSTDLLNKDKSIIENINAFLENLSKLECDNNLDEFLFYYDNLYSGDNLTFDNDAVIVTTIHQSKGLEYPIVFVPMASGTLSNADSTNKLLYDRELGISILDFDNKEYETSDNIATFATKIKKQLKTRQELSRLLYVALTRAKNHLFVIGKEIKGQKPLKKVNSFMGFLYYAREHNGHFDKYFKELEIDENSENIEDKPSIINDKLSIDFSSLEWEYPYKTDVYSPAKYTVSQLLESDNQSKKIFVSSSPKEGIAYHTIMQYIDFNCNSKDDINNQIDMIYKRELIDEEMKNLIDIDKVYKILQSDIINLAKKSKIYREQPFVMYTDDMTKGNDKVLIQGVIDLIIVDKKATLVDFKVSKGNPNYLKDKYKKQLDLYAKAIEQTMKIEVERKVIYNILQDIEIEI